jgi:hypothetical protein
LDRGQNRELEQLRESLNTVCRRLESEMCDVWALKLIAERAGIDWHSQLPELRDNPVIHALVREACRPMRAALEDTLSCPSLSGRHAKHEAFDA